MEKIQLFESKQIRSHWDNENELGIGGHRGQVNVIVLTASFYNPINR